MPCFQILVLLLPKCTYQASDFPEGQCIHSEPAEEKIVIVGYKLTEVEPFSFFLSRLFQQSFSLHESTLQPLTTPENTITYHNTLCLSPQNFA